MEKPEVEESASSLAGGTDDARPPEPAAAADDARSSALASTADDARPPAREGAADDVLRQAPAATSAAVRKCMQGNKRRDTTPELKVRALLRELGYPGYRLDWKKAPGHPDIAYPGRKIAIFVMGCFLTSYMSPCMAVKFVLIGQHKGFAMM